MEQEVGRSLHHLLGNMKDIIEFVGENNGLMEV